MSYVAITLENKSKVLNIRSFLKFYIYWQTVNLDKNYIIYLLSSSSAIGFYFSASQLITFLHNVLSL